MIIPSQSKNYETRFADLLQPIRDLTRNWNVDIAHYLEQYLAELHDIVISFNGSKTTMNFAEAALLIQGSTSVYSKKFFANPSRNWFWRSKEERKAKEDMKKKVEEECVKVEYLHSLVYQVMDTVTNKKKQKMSSVDQGNCDDNCDFADDGEEFLLLDDVNTGDADKLKSHDIPEKESNIIPYSLMTFINREEADKGNDAFYNSKGELLGHLSDFQMNRSSIQSNGEVFLDKSLLSLLHSDLRILASSTPFPNKGAGNVNQNEAVPGESMNVVSTVSDIVSHASSVLPFELLDPQDNLAQDNDEEIVEAPPALIADCWAVIDPYGQSKETEKQLKIGCTFKLPNAVQQSFNLKRKRSKAKARELEPITRFVEKRVYSHRQKYSNSGTILPDFEEFDDLFWKEFNKRKEKRQHQEMFDQSAAERLPPEEELAEGYISRDLDDDDDNDDAVDDCHENAGANNLAVSEIQMNDDTFLTSVQACGGQFTNSLGVEMICGSAGSVYKDMVRQYVEKYLVQAAKYIDQSELSKRVAQWEDRMTPKLVEEEKRESFDIHAYESVVLASLQRNQFTSFCTIVGTQPLYQISRLFLATLQLANNYNVELKCDGELEEAMDNLYICLVSTKRHHEQLTEYQAPSLYTL